MCESERREGGREREGEREGEGERGGSDRKNRTLTTVHFYLSDMMLKFKSCHQRS